MNDSSFRKKINGSLFTCFLTFSGLDSNTRLKDSWVFLGLSLIKKSMGFSNASVMPASATVRPQSRTSVFFAHCQPLHTTSVRTPGMTTFYVKPVIKILDHRALYELYELEQISWTLRVNEIKEPSNKILSRF